MYINLLLFNSQDVSLPSNWYQSHVSLPLLLIRMSWFDAFSLTQVKVCGRSWSTHDVCKRIYTRGGVGSM
jgi:hypothetical protein